MKLRAILLWLVGSIWLTVWSVARYNAGLATSYDLGIFAQSAKSWAAPGWPHSDIRGLWLLGDHFSPILAVNGLLWRIWPDPRVLLVGQAALIALAMVIVWWTARALVGERIALLLFAIGLLARGTIAANLFDVHEVAYAAPAVALLAAALVRGSFRIAVGSAVVLVLVKEDLGLTVIAAAVAWWLLHRADPGGDRWRRPALLAGIGVAGLVAAVAVLRMVGTGGGYGSFFGGSGAVPLGQSVDTGWSWWRLAPLGLFAATALFVGLRSVVAVLAVPTLAWRAVADNPSYWHLDSHYDLILVPIALIAAADAVHRRHPDFGTGSHPAAAVPGESRSGARVVAAGLGAAITVGLGVGQLVQRGAPPWQAIVPAQRYDDIMAIAAQIPADQPVAASNTTGAYLVAGHDHVYSLRTAPAVRYLIFTTDRRSLFELSSCQRAALRPEAARAIGEVVLVRYPQPRRITLPQC